MNTTQGYNAALREHANLIKQTAERYLDPGSKRIKWAKAFQDNPELANTLFVGEGTQNDKIKRLSNVWRYMKKKAGVPPTRASKDGTQSAIFDKHRAELEALAREFAGPNGSVRWQKALAANPVLAQAIGFDGLERGSQSFKRFLALIGFWFRDRARGGRVVRRELSETMKQLYASGGSAGHVRGTGKPRKSIGPFMSKLPEPPVDIPITAGAVAPAAANNGTGLHFCPCCGTSLDWLAQALEGKAAHEL
jgi:hypothetical protein